jgi:uncharacterized protein (TIGR00369 family)
MSGWDPENVGVLPEAEALKLSGLDFLQGIVEGRYPIPPISALMPFRITGVGEGWAVFEGDPDFSLYNPLGTVHGGFALTIMDSVLGCAVMSRLPPGVRCTSLETKVNFLRTITKDTGHLRAEANAVHVGRRTGLAEGRLTDRDGKILAFGTSTVAILGN